MRVFVAKCAYPGERREGQGEFGPQISASFYENGKENTKENRLYVNEKVDGKDAKRLQVLRKDQAVILVEVPPSGRAKLKYKLADLSPELLSAIKGGSGNGPVHQEAPPAAQVRPETADRAGARISPASASRIALECYTACLGEAEKLDEIEVPDNVLGLLASKAYEEVMKRL